MTTLASNAPAGEALAPQPAAATAKGDGTAPPAPEAARTIASRFIILTLCLAIVLSTLAFGAVHSISLGVFALGAAFVAFWWTVDAWRTRRLRFSRSAIQLPLLGLFAFGVVQVLPLSGAARTISLDPYATRLVLVQLGALCIYFAAALAFIDSPGRLRLVVRTVIIFGFLLACFGMMQAVVSPEKIFGLRELKQAVGYGPFINRHHFAGYMELTAALPLGMLFAGAVGRDQRLLYAFAALMMGVSLAMTNSRGGMLSLVAEIMFLAVMSGAARSKGESGEGGRRSRLRGLALRAGGGFALVLVLFAGVIMFGGEGALSRLVGTVNSADPTTGRAHFWRGTLGIIRDHALLGAGLGAFPSAYPRYDTGDGKLYRLEQAHNDYLQLVSDAGAVGAALGLFFVAALFRAGLRRMQSEDTYRSGVALGALTGCFGVLVHSLFDFTLHTTANALLFLTLAALAVVNGRVEQVQRRRHRRRRSSRGAEVFAERAAA